MAEETKTIDAAAVDGVDANGDGHISKEEMEMHLEFKRKELEDQDADPEIILDAATMLTKEAGRRLPDDDDFG